MARRKKEKVKEDEIQGMKYLGKLRPLLERLHEIGTARDKAKNRQLFFDDLVMLLLLHFFSPTITSLRGLQQASELKIVQRKLGLKRSSLGSLSESTRV